MPPGETDTSSDTPAGAPGRRRQSWIANFGLRRSPRHAARRQQAPAGVDRQTRREAARALPVRARACACVYAFVRARRMDELFDEIVDGGESSSAVRYVCPSL